jgi:hypothetical protein
MTLLPPPQYDVPPSIPVIEYVVSATEIEKAQRFCGHVLPGYVPFGCSQVAVIDGHKRCYVWLMKSDERHVWTTPTLDEVRRHEHAHCNGWPTDHSALRR